MPGNGRTIYEDFSTKVRIQSIQKSDEGTYMCRGSNTVGASTKTEVELIMQCEYFFISPLLTSIS